MTSLGRILTLALALGLGPVATGHAQSVESLRALFITGEDHHHSWESNLSLITEHLASWGITTIDEKIVSEADEWLEWDGDYNDYDVLVIMYYQPTAAEASLEAISEYVAQGGGLVVVHSALAGFNGQATFDELVGIGWRAAEYGRSLMFDPDGNAILRETAEGGGAAHPPIQPFEVRIRDDQHPITNGLPAVWMQADDELYYNLRGPVGNIHTLAVAPVPNTTESAPQLWVNEHGQGRVFVTTLGHHEPGVDSVGFTTTLARGIEWAATGDVTLEVPTNFPSADEPSGGTPVLPAATGEDGNGN
jgi:uncharacterized protein